MNEDLIEGLFDLINDGNVDSHERAAAIALFHELVAEEERREFLEEEGLDPDDCDFD